MRVACANKEKSEYYEMEAETLYFLGVFFVCLFFVFVFLFDDKIIIKRKTSDICMCEIVPYIKGNS